MSHKLTKEQILEVIEKYNGGASAGLLSRQYSISPTSIYALMKRRGIDRRSYSESSRKYTLNEEYFNAIDSPDKAYFLGFLMADGYNNEERGVVELSCAEKDKEILDKLNILIGSNKPVRLVNSKGIRSCRIDWCSRKLSNDLLKYGCMQAKSLKLVFPTLEEDVIRHFIRGYFDGDGCISYGYSPRSNVFGNSFNSIVSFTSTEGFCLCIKKYVKKHFDIHSTMLCRHPLHNNNNRTLQISGNNQVVKLMSWMYDNAEIFLQRKWDKFLELQNKINSRAKNLKSIRDDRKNMLKIKDIVKNRTEHWNARYFITHKIIECNGKSCFTEEQSKILREKLDLYGENLAIPQELINDELRKAKESGFPYYNFSTEYMNKRMGSMMGFEPKTENGLYKWDGFGTELANYFHPQMFECRKKGRMSAIDFFNSDENLYRGIWKLICLYPKITPSNIREICCNELASSRINNFPPRVMMTVLKHLYNGKNITMLDPCAGFSGRLLGSYASNIVKKYIGIDLSEKTYNGLIKTKEWINSINNKNFESNIIQGSCLDILPTIKENVDLVFTSPPFLDEEEYIGIPVEKNYDMWKQIFIRPFIERAHEVLKTGGLFSVYTEAIRRNDFPFDFCNIAQEVGFKRLDDINFKMPSRENLRKDRTFRIVKMVVFEKIT